MLILNSSLFALLCVALRRGGPVGFSSSGRSGHHNLNVDGASVDRSDDDADSRTSDFNDIANME